MTFPSLSFLAFLFAVAIVFRTAPPRFRCPVLLVASYVFYGSFGEPFLLILMAIVTVISYTGGIALQRRRNEAGAQYLLAGLIILLLTPLALTRYLPEFFAAIAHPGTAKALVAIGISYYLLQAISYLVDVHLEASEAETDFGRFATYLSFFPKLLQGPIERGNRLLPQLQMLEPPDAKGLAAGARLFMLGMFKKAFIADSLAGFIDPVYGNVHAHSGLSLIAATYLFSLQLYFDFSGYTDMARGVARFFNVTLTENFNAPYFATSVADFWRRWHISFSSWLQDYIFTPFQFRFRYWALWGTPCALLFTFLVSGIWHGASWNFVIWGLLHGAFLATGAASAKWKRKLYRRLGIEKSPLLGVWQTIVTFNLVSFAWIFFRAATVPDALHVTRSALAALPGSVVQLACGDQGAWQQLFLDHTPWQLLPALSAALVVAGVDFISRRKKNAAIFDPAGFFDRLPLWSHGVVYGCAVYLSVICGSVSQSFIYQSF
jgi:alginate O-acetyltransferase complex protein AlgI